MLILNDIHIGHHRAGGTTPASREKLRAYLFQSLRNTLDNYVGHVLINGDLFDEFEVDPRDWVETYTMLHSQLAKGQGRRITLVAGNHDHSPKANRVSSFEMLCEVMGRSYPENFNVVGLNGIANVAPGVDVIAHCPNQDLFNQRLEQALTRSPKFLLLHANYDNKFAVESDHSLNVSREVALQFKEVGTTLVFAHEHQARTALGGSVVVLGNQWPTSIADCLGNDKKFAHHLDKHDGVNLTLAPIATWEREQVVGGFREIDWRELEESNADFVRVTGQAANSEASEVINVIAKFRVHSECFVVTNAVQIDGIAETEALPTNFEAVKKFDVTEFIKNNLTPEEYAVVEGLITEGA